MFAAMVKHYEYQFLIAGVCLVFTFALYYYLNAALINASKFCNCKRQKAFFLL